MTLLKWKPAYSLAVPSVDLEHREMIGLINQCYDQLGANADSDSIERFLGKIHSGISAHFALEEQLMQRTGYSEYEAHKEDHEDLLDEIRDLMDQYVENPDAGAAILQERLANWFGRHFSTFAARLHEHFPH